MIRKTRLIAITISFSIAMAALGSFTASATESQDLTDVFTISAENVTNYSYNNKDQVVGEIKEIAVDIQGLSYQDLKVDPNPMDIELGKRSVLVVQPWAGPWNWMNFQTVDIVDQVIAATLEKYNLSEDIPIVLYGRSMGGVGVLSYSVYGKYKPTAIAGNSPVTDLHYHTTERPDVARSIYRAYAYYDCGPEIGVELHCPMCQIDKLPDVPYLIVAGDADSKVNKEAHSDKFVAAMKGLGRNVTYIEVAGMEHVEFDGGDFNSFPDVLNQYIDFISSFAK